MDLPFHSAEQLINSQIKQDPRKVRGTQKEQKITFPQARARGLRGPFDWLEGNSMGNLERTEANIPKVRY